MRHPRLMRRPTLRTKLIVAALPLVVAVVGLLALTVRNDLGTANRAETGAQLGGVWDPLVDALAAVDTEAAAITGDDASSPTARRATDQAINALRDDIETIGAAKAAGDHITASRSALSAARRNIDMATIAPDMAGDIDPGEAYALASRELVAVGQLLPSEAGAETLGRQLLAVVKLAETKLAANSVIAGTAAWRADPADTSGLVTARDALQRMQATLGEFEAIAPETWAAQYRLGGFATQLAGFSGQLDRAARAAQAGEPASFDTASFGGFVSEIVAFQGAISDEIVAQASEQADAARRTALIRIGVSLGAVLLAALIALLLTRSITRRIKLVADSANRIAARQLPALVEALRDPRGKAVLPGVEPVKATGHDELTELANAFNSMQHTLVDVANEQVDVLRRGVSDIFITMARRNRSLIDRQLAMLDEFEAEIDDPSVLANYYQLDHLATRMRRNSESLLVLGNAEPRRRRIPDTEIDDVVRASISEVEDYRRIDVEQLESVRLRGRVVADVSHLLAELLDNATSFSSPDTTVLVGGRHHGASYLIRIVDKGMGIADDRLADLNELLREPPVLGLAVESTLGMSVVSLLAHKHSIDVTLSPGQPGLIVDISLPSAVLAALDTPAAAAPAAAVQATPVLPATSAAAVLEPTVLEPTVLEPTVLEPTVLEATVLEADQELEAVGAVGISRDGFGPDPRSEPIERNEHRPATQPLRISEPDDRPVAASDWTRMSLDLSAFMSGRASAASRHDTSAPTLSAPELPPPPPTTRVHGEFDTPPAPPLTVSGPSRRPVTPESARPVPAHQAAPSLPSPRLPARGSSQGTDDGRAAELATTSSERPGFAAAPDTAAPRLATGLPTRAPVTARFEPGDQPLATTPSRLDPDALRERLRAFQTEFRTGLLDQDTGQHTGRDK